jgi:hypothetical protein
MFSFLKRWQCKNRVGEGCKSCPEDTAMCLRLQCPNLQEIEDVSDETGKASQFQCLQGPEGDRRYPKWDNVRDFLAKEEETPKPKASPNLNPLKTSLWKAVLSLFSL